MRHKNKKLESYSWRKAPRKQKKQIKKTLEHALKTTRIYLSNK
jgi:hypothetical protein